MISGINLLATRERSSDRLELRAYLQQLVGQPLLFLRFSYGDELTLHFGHPTHYASSKLAHMTKGSYVIGARASFWYLRTHMPPAIIAGESRPVSQAPRYRKQLTPEQVERADILKKDVRIVGVDAIILGTVTRSAYGFGLSLLLEDDASLLILPARRRGQNSRQRPVSDWEVFTPYGRYLSVGPGLRWSYLSSRTAAEASA
jgi:hypothetical protein